MPAREVESGGQKQLKPVKRKQEKGQKLEFEAGKVFDVKANEEIELDMESSQYKAQQGQGGDRRA